MKVSYENNHSYWIKLDILKRGTTSGKKEERFLSNQLGDEIAYLDNLLQSDEYKNDLEKITNQHEIINDLFEKYSQIKSKKS